MLKIRARAKAGHRSTITRKTVPKHWTPVSAAVPGNGRKESHMPEVRKRRILQFTVASILMVGAAIVYASTPSGRPERCGEQGVFARIVQQVGFAQEAASSRPCAT